MPKQINLKDVTISIITLLHGTHTFNDKAKGDYVSVTFNEDAIKELVGADGEVTWALNPNETGVITLTATEGSDLNRFLSDVYNTSKFTGKLGFAITVKQNATGTRYWANVATIKKHADLGHSDEVSTRSWPITCVKLQVRIKTPQDVQMI
jgi:hypothetical protein